MNEKLLIVSWAVYPSTTGSAVIVDNIVTAFSDEGVVLFGETVENIRQGKNDKVPSNIYHFDPNIRLMGRGQKYFRWLNFGKMTRFLLDVAQREKCTAVLAIFPDEFYMHAAYRVSQKLGLPFYTWFHNTYLDNRTGTLKTLAKRLQPLFFKAARINFVMSDGMNIYYKEAYSELSFTTLTHGFKIPNVSFEPFEPNKKTTRFLFSGSISESCRDATVRQIKTIIKNPNYHVHLFTGSPMSEFEMHGISGDNVHHEGFVTLEELVQRFEKFDIMLLPHGFDGKRTEVEYKTIFPTRTIPLLYSNRPILAHTPKGVFLTDFLRQHDCAEIVDEKDENAIEEAINRLINDDNRREEVIRNAIRTASLFDINTVGKQLKTAIFSEEKGDT